VARLLNLMPSSNQYELSKLHIVILQVLRFIFISVLLGAFSSKLLSTNYYPMNSMLYHLSAVIELFLVFWLLSGLCTQLCLTGIACFFGIGLISNSLLFGTNTTCECFGAIRIQPLLMMVINVLCLIACTYCMLFRLPPANSKRPTDPIFNKYVLGICCFVGLVGIYSATHQYVINQFIFRDSFILLNPVLIDNEISGDQADLYTIRLLNNSAATIRVAGFRSSCNCIAATTLPVIISPNSVQVIQVRVSKSSIPSDIQISFYIESPSVWLNTRLHARAKHTTVPISGS
jgi:hypothetical protein